MGKLLDFFKTNKRPEPEQTFPTKTIEQLIERAYDAAEQDRLTADWQVSGISANQEVSAALVIMRNRARDLYRNNSYVKHYIDIMQQNVVGENGIQLQAQIKSSRGKLDKFANDKIEASFKEWSRRGNSTVCGRHSFRAVQNLVLSADRLDGEALLIKVEGYDNQWGYALQILESDHLDLDYSLERLPNGNRIVMGVEIDGWLKPVAYHVLAAHPGDGTYLHSNKYRYRVAAKDVLHIFSPSRPEQVRGVPHLHTVMKALNMLDGFQEAMLVKERMNACIGMIIEQQQSHESAPDSYGANNMPEKGFAPGMKERLNPGEKAVLHSPNSPSTGMSSFKKAILQDVAGGTGVAYNTLSNDLESVNFSSIRSGKLQEQKKFKCLQSMLIEQLCDPNYAAWLKMALLSDLRTMSYANFDKYLRVNWQGQGFPWVDPRADMAANIMGLNAGLYTKTKILSQMGVDYNDNIAELEKEMESEKKAGLWKEEDTKPVGKAVPSTAKGGKHVSVSSARQEPGDASPKAK